MRFNMFPPKVKIKLSEVDNQIVFKALFTALESEGGVLIDEKWGVAGSVEVSIWRYKIGNKKILIEAGTYQGLEISGEKKLVERIVSKMEDNS
jgi:hypothetical protein